MTGRHGGAVDGWMDLAKLACGLSLTPKEMGLFLRVGVWQYCDCCPRRFAWRFQKSYPKYCIPVRVSCDACLVQSDQGREEEEVWPNRGNVRGADSVLEEWRQVQLGIMHTYQENWLCFYWNTSKGERDWSSGTTLWHSLTIIMSAAKLNNEEEDVSPSHTRTSMFIPGVNVFRGHTHTHMQRPSLLPLKRL